MLFDIISCYWMLLIEINWLMVDACAFHCHHYMYVYYLLSLVVMVIACMKDAFWLMYYGWIFLIEVLRSLSSAWWILVDVFWLCILIDVFWLMYFNWCMMVDVLWLMCFDWCTMIDACMVSWCVYGCPWLELHDRYMINIHRDIMNWWLMY